MGPLISLPRSSTRPTLSCSLVQVKRLPIRADDNSPSKDMNHLVGTSNACHLLRGINSRLTWDAQGTEKSKQTNTREQCGLEAKMATESLCTLNGCPCRNRDQIWLSAPTRASHSGVSKTANRSHHHIQRPMQSSPCTTMSKSRDECPNAHGRLLQQSKPMSVPTF